MVPKHVLCILFLKIGIFQIGDGYASNFLSVQPEEKLTVRERDFTINMKIEKNSIDDVTIYRSSQDSFSSWVPVDAKIEDKTASFQTQDGGVFVAVVHKKSGAIIGGVIGGVVLLAIIIIAIVVFTRKNPNTLSTMTRSLQKRV